MKSINDTDDYSGWSNATFTYNSSNQLIAVQNTYTDGTSVDTYTWNNGRITKLTYTEMAAIIVKKMFTNILIVENLQRLLPSL